jgi:hypothetical protein
MDEPERSTDKSTAEIEAYWEDFKRQFWKSIREPKFVLEILGFVVLAIYAMFTSLMYVANRDAANAAQSSAETASNTLKWTQQQFRIEKRPWLSSEPRGGTRLPSRFSLPNGKIATAPPDGTAVIVNNVLAAAVDLRNIGTSPAIDVESTHTDYFFGPRDQIEHEVQQYVPDYPSHRGSIVAMGTTLTAQSDVRTLKPEELQHIEDGTWELFIVGAVSYRDVFFPPIAPYETTYCYLFTPQGLPFHNCKFDPPAFGNSMK